MTTVLELEGTWEEIKAQFPDFNGQKLHVIVRALEAEGEGTPSPSPLAAALAQIWASVPSESWDKLPADYAENLDHYIYGWPPK